MNDLLEDTLSFWLLSRFYKLLYLLPKSLWDDIQPISLMDTIANKPEPTKEPIPEKKKKRPMMALCMDFGAAE